MIKKGRRAGRTGEERSCVVIIGCGPLNAWRVRPTKRYAMPNWSGDRRLKLFPTLNARLFVVSCDEASL